MKRKTTQLATSLLASLALIGPTDAREEAGGFYITPSLSYFFFDQERNLDNDAAIGLGLGYEFNRQWAVRIMGDWMELDQDRGRQEVDGLWWHGDLLYHWNINDRWRPYALVGIGDFRTDPEEGGHDRSTTYNLGVGIKKEVHDRVDVRMEALGLYGQDDSHWDGALQVGFNYLFGVSSRPAEPEPPRDSDGDGVYDPDDRCPNTPAGTEVDAQGCPLPVGDEDQDGVTDDLDRCPATPRGARVDAQGCPLQLKETVTRRLDVKFETESARIDREYLGDVESLAAFLREYPDTEVVIEGHSDSTGSEAFNLKLSQERADSVRNHLIEYFNISPDRIRAVGYGESRPIASNETPEGRQENRRVVAVVSAIVTKTQMKQDTP